MKKMVYQQPTTTIVVVEHMQMLAESGQPGEKKFSREGYTSTGAQNWGGSNVKANTNFVDWDNE